jgi:GAF domain-containing protein
MRNTLRRGIEAPNKTGTSRQILPSVLTLSAANSILVEISSIPDGLEQQDFLNRVVQVIHAHVKVYFVGFFVLDPDERWVVFRSGSAGKATDSFLRHGHKLDINHPQGWMGNVVHGHEILLVGLDEQKVLTYSLSTESHWSLDVEFKQEHGPLRWGGPLLPETRWELFLPLRSEKKVKGILWIHSSEISGFEMEDIILFQLLADQTSARLWLSNLDVVSKEGSAC